MAQTNAEKVRAYKLRVKERKAGQEPYKHGVQIRPVVKGGQRGIEAILVLTPDEWLDLEDRAETLGQDVDTYVGEIIADVVEDYCIKRRANREG